jgi:hypothetical protein
LPELYLSFVVQTLQGDDSRLRYSRCFFEGRIGRFQKQCSLRNGYIFGPSAKAAPAYVTEYLIAWPKLLYVSANRPYPPRHVTPRCVVFWS